MATTTRQSTRRGAPAPKGSRGIPQDTLRRAVARPTVTDVSQSLPPQNGRASPLASPDSKSGNNPFLSAFTIFLYGISGVGKTSMAAHFPDVGFLHDPGEEGIIELVKFGRVPKPKFIESAETLEDTLGFLADVANKKYKIQHLCLDSATGFERLVFQFHCRENFDDDWTKEGFYGYQAGPKNAAKTDVPVLLSALDDVRKSGIGVIFIGHAQVKTFKNPNGPDYDQYKPYLDVETWQQIHRWAQCVMFYDLIVELEKEKGAIRKKPKPETRRVLYTEPVGSCISKNWWGLEGVINAGDSGKSAYDAFVAAYRKAARKGGN